MQFVIHTRVEHACMLLRETALSVEQIADACGYRDVFFFSRQFKKVTASPPAAYRNSIRSRGKAPEKPLRPAGNGLRK
jgi:transcriptional regulator GlxA family with amidase domain